MGSFSRMVIKCLEQANFCQYLRKIEKPRLNILITRVSFTCGLKRKVIFKVKKIKYFEALKQFFNYKSIQIGK